MFIVFEGLDGSGKSTQVDILEKKLKEISIDAITLREPGSTPLGEQILKILESKYELNPIMEFMLFSLSRAAIVEQKIKPLLGQDKIVICDRYFYSSIAYQGAGRNLDRNLIEHINNKIVSDIIPDLVIYLDLNWEEKLNRKGIDINDRFEKENENFHNNVRSCYLEMSEKESDRWIVIDANNDVDYISNLIYSKISKYL